MKYNLDEIMYYDIGNSKIKARISNYGCTLMNLWIRDNDGNYRDVVLGYRNIEDYFDNPPCFGSCVLPNANRIEDAKFTLNGRTYSLDKNDGNNNLHSGYEPLHKRLWQITSSSLSEASFTIRCNDMDMGFPGNRKFDVKYIIDDNRLQIDYKCFSDADTVFNPTNHSYFNLLGHNSGDILNHELNINANAFTPSDEHAICHGDILSVKSTPMDFLTPHPIGKLINEDYNQLIWGNGYDHNFILNINCSKPGEDLTIPAATLSCNDMSLNIYTTAPCIQLYTGNYLSSNDIGKDSCHYAPRSGVALETQFAPNSINLDQFLKPTIKKNTSAVSTTIYEFD